MQFNQAQIRDTIGISVETFRHWKRVLPPFKGRKKYTIGDLLASGVLRQLTEVCGVRAGYLTEISKAIVEVCNAEAWASLRGKTIVIDIDAQRCVLVRSLDEFVLRDVVLVLPLEGIFAQIQQQLSADTPIDSQHHLRFPPIAIGQVRAQRRRA